MVLPLQKLAGSISEVYVLSRLMNSCVSSFLSSTFCSLDSSLWLSWTFSLLCFITWTFHHLPNLHSNFFAITNNSAANAECVYWCTYASVLLGYIFRTQLTVMKNLNTFQKHQTIFLSGCRNFCFHQQSV